MWGKEGGSPLLPPHITSHDFHKSTICANNEKRRAADHDKRLYVQVSWTLEDKQTEEREYASLEAFDDSYPKILVTMDDIPFKNRKGIENIQAWRLEEFLGH